MPLGALADLVVVLHAAFLVFVGLGGLLTRRAPNLVWLHLPALVWGASTIGVGIQCPLTLLEKRLRRADGQEPYPGGFVDRYIEDVVYPDGLTPVLWSIAAGIAVLSYTQLLLTVKGRRDLSVGGR